MFVIKLTPVRHIRNLGRGLERSSFHILCLATDPHSLCKSKASLAHIFIMPHFQGPYVCVAKERRILAARPFVVFVWSVGTLSKDDDDGCENATNLHIQ